jgi:hypothetical protein
LGDQRIASGTHAGEVDLGFRNGSRAIQQRFIGIRARKLEGYLFDRTESEGSLEMGMLRPWRSAFRAERTFPALVFGPLLALALA